jgi:hypothetical protein
MFLDTECNYWTGKQFEADLTKSPMPDPIKQGNVSAAKDNLPSIASGTRFVKQGGRDRDRCELRCGARPLSFACGNSVHLQERAATSHGGRRPQSRHQCAAPGVDTCLRLRPCSFDQDAQIDPGSCRVGTAPGNRLSFSVPGPGTCGEARQGLQVGTGAVGLVISSDRLLKKSATAWRRSPSRPRRRRGRQSGLQEWPSIFDDTRMAEAGRCTLHSDTADSDVGARSSAPTLLRRIIWGGCPKARRKARRMRWRSENPVSRAIRSME